MTVEAPQAAALAAEPRRLDPLLRPRSVVVVGASPNPSFVSSIFKNLLKGRFTGNVAAVNPRYHTIEGAACYPSILDVPWPIDLVVVGVSWRQFPMLLEHCEDKKARALVVITSGFAETGGEGTTRQQHLSEWARRTDTPVAGPNCLGLMHVPSGVYALPSPFPTLVEGELGLILQSGMMAPSVITPLFERNIGLTFAITSGNEADVGLAEYIRYLVDDEQTRVIGCFAEQIKDPSAFIEACQLAADVRKPIVMLKIGRSEAARRAALAHTGSLVGADGVIDTVLAKHGVTRVSSVDELFEAIAVLHTRRLPRGDGLAAVSVSGGAAGLLSDLASACGVRFAQLTPDTEARLRDVVPEFGNVGNPLDVTGQGVFQPELLERSLDLLARDPAVDTIVYARSFAARIDGESPAYRALQASAEQHPGIPLLVMSLAGGHFFASATLDAPIQRALHQLDGVPFLQGAEYGLRAIGALARYSRFLRERENAAEPRRSAPGAGAVGESVVACCAGTRLSSGDSADILKAYGIPLVAEVRVRTPEQAVAAAQRIGYPVVAKVEAAGLAHKAAAGGVILDIRNAATLESAFNHLWRLRTDTSDVAVQQMVTDGIAEVIVGMSRDPQFGPVIACGLGGVFVDALQDVQLLVPPLTVVEIGRALQRLRGAPLLARADLPALIDLILRFSELCMDLHDRFSAIDLNPLIVRRPGAGVVAVDSLFELAGSV